MSRKQEAIRALTIRLYETKREENYLEAAGKATRIVEKTPIDGEDGHGRHAGPLSEDEWQEFKSHLEGIYGTLVLHDIRHAIAVVLEAREEV